MQLLDIFKPISHDLIVKPDEQLDRLYKNFGIQQTGCLFVVDKAHLKGFISDGDLRRFIAKKNNSDLFTAENVMTKNLQTANKEMFVFDAFRLMSNKEINHLPIVEGNNELIGYVTYHQLAPLMSPEQLFINLNQVDKCSDNELRHLARYYFAANFIRPNSKVLDCACGSGYGSNILARNGATVLGVDLSKESIMFANDNYGGQSITFKSSNIDNLEFLDASFDAIVTLETLEHIPNDSCRKYITNIARWLKPGGILVASSPMLRMVNDKPYITNPYHINEMLREDLLAMFKTILSEFTLHFYHQKETNFMPLNDEKTGFCILVARKRESNNANE